MKDEPNGIMTKADLTEKDITPIGSFLHYGEVTQAWIMLKGNITEYNNLLITWRKSFLPQVSRKTEKKNERGGRRQLTSRIMKRVGGAICDREFASSLPQW